MENRSKDQSPSSCFWVNVATLSLIGSNCVCWAGSLRWGVFCWPLVVIRQSTKMIQNTCNSVWTSLPVHFSADPCGAPCGCNIFTQTVCRTAVGATSLHTYQRTDGVVRTVLNNPSSHFTSLKSANEYSHFKVFKTTGLWKRIYCIWIPIKHLLRPGWYLSFLSGSFLSPVGTPLI